MANDFKFSTKAKNISQLAGKLTSAKVPEFLTLFVRDWKHNPEQEITSIRESLGHKGLLAIRSSGAAEDGEVYSHAGEFLSVLNVDSDHMAKEAINNVIDSYGKPSVGTNEVLIQRMLKEVEYSGVALTSDGSVEAPYWVIDTSAGADTAAVTAGHATIGIGNSERLVFLSGSSSTPPEKYKGVYNCITEIIFLTGKSALDIEFAISNEEVWLLQVRPKTGVESQDKSIIENLLSTIVSFDATERDEHSCYSIMSDWNPAEMIGVKPKPLAYDLYRRLMTDSSWATGRIKLGYTAVDQPLMQLMGGTPYCSVHLSVRSLLPAKTPMDIHEAAVAGVVKLLRAHPYLHDKLEFSLIPSCITSDTDNLIQALGLSTAQGTNLNILLTELTNNLLVTQECEQALDYAHSMYILLQSMNSKTTRRSVAELVIYAKELAWRFSLVARLAFVATAILKSFQKNNVIRSGFLDELTASLPSLTEEMVVSLTRDRDVEFKRKYGHLRPGTYHIESATYDQKYNDYKVGGCLDERKKHKVEFTKTEIIAVAQELTRLGLKFDPQHLIEFTTRAIPGREFLKFIYSGYVSHILDNITLSASGSGLSKQDAGFMTLDEAEGLGNHGLNLDTLRLAIEKRRKKYRQENAIRSPSIIFNDTRLSNFIEQVSRPNYITEQTATGEAVTLNVDTSQSDAINGKIVLIEHADPGYDWIFASDIRGLITAYGGENSHMAIRARELNLPSVIGIGSERFRKVSASRRVKIDCAEMTLETVE